MKLTSTLLPAACSDEWLADCYSEYLLSCAEDLTDLNQAICDQVADDTISDIIDDYHDEVDPYLDGWSKTLRQFAINNGCTVDDISNRTQKYYTAMDSFTITVPARLLWPFYASYFPGFSLDTLVYALIHGTFCADDTLFNYQPVLDAANSAAIGVMSSLGYQDGSLLSLQDGYVNMKGAIVAILLHSNLATSDPSITLEAVGSLDEELDSVVTTVDGLIGEMKDNVASAIAWAQGFAAVKVKNVADRITNFISRSKSAFSSAFIDANQHFSNVQAILADANVSVRSFIDQATTMLGWTTLLSSNSALGVSDVSEYTGASPLAAIDLHSLKSVANVAASAVIAAGYAVWQGMKTIGSKLWAKVRPVVRAVTSNPVDIDVIDSTATSYQVDTWSYNGYNSIRLKYNMDGSPESDSFVARLRGYIDKSIAWDNMFGTLLINVRSCTLLQPTGADWTIQMGFDYSFKPKCLNVSAAVQAGLCAVSQGYAVPISRRHTSQWLSALVAFSQTQSMYCSDDADEGVMASGFRLATMLFGALGSAQLCEFYGQSSAWNGWLGEVAVCVDRDDYNSLVFAEPQSSGIDIFDVMWSAIMPDAPYNPAVSNRDFLDITSGYAGSDSYSPGYGPGWFNLFLPSEFQMVRGGFNYSFGIAASLYTAFFALQVNDRVYNPGDFLFLPYSTSSLSFGDARYVIKTDAQNAAIADAIVSAIVIVVGVAAIVLLGWKVARTIKKAKFKKWTALKGRLDNAMWNGYSLTPKEWRQYLRADRKLSKINLWSRGTSSANLISGDSPKGSASNLLQVFSTDSASGPRSDDDVSRVLMVLNKAIVQ